MALASKESPRPTFFFSSRRRHTRYWRDWSSDVCSSDLFERQMAGQHLAFEYAAFPRQRHPGCAQGNNQRLELGYGPGDDRLGFVALLKLKPVEAVWRQRNHVRQFADRREPRAAEHFQRNAAIEGGEIRFGGLPRG